MKDSKTKVFERLSNDELTELVSLAQNGNEDALEQVLKGLSGMVRAVSRSYYFAGADNDDVIQEGMIGLFMAVMNFDKAKNISFYNFAQTCVNNRIVSAVKSAARKKHNPLNFYISVSHDGLWDEHTEEFAELMAKDGADNPESLIIRREDERLIKLNLQDLLTSLEQSVLIRYLQGMSYKDISQELGKTQKSVANAVFRVRRKLRKHYAES